MSEPCENCRPAVQLETLLGEFNILKDKVSKLETNTAVNEEQTKMVFKILNEIKDSIKIIADKIDTLEKRPGQNWQELVKTVVTVTVSIAVTYFITKK